MILTRRTVLGILSAGIGCAALPARTAFAHRQKQALTTISWNARTKNLEVIHDLFAHDAEEALARLGRLDKPDLTPLRARAKLALYTQEHFSIKTLTGKAIDLTIIGVEVDSALAHIYLEAPMPKPPKGLIVTNTILMDMFPAQTNRVLLDLGRHPPDVVFVAGDGPKKILA